MEQKIITTVKGKGERGNKSGIVKEAGALRERKKIGKRDEENWKEGG